MHSIQNEHAFRLWASGPAAWKSSSGPATPPVLCLLAVLRYDEKTIARAGRTKQAPCGALRKVVATHGEAGAKHTRGISKQCAQRKTFLTIYLMSGVKLSGRIKSFDKYSVVLETNNQEQLIFKHAISTVVVSKPFHAPAHSHAGVGRRPRSAAAPRDRSANSAFRRRNRAPGRPDT